MVRQQLASVTELTEEQINTLYTFIAKMNAALFTGDDVYSQEEKETIRHSEEYQLLATYSYFLKQYVDSLLEDKSPDNALTLPIMNDSLPVIRREGYLTMQYLFFES